MAAIKLKQLHIHLQTPVQQVRCILNVTTHLQSDSSKVSKAEEKTDTNPELASLTSVSALIYFYEPKHCHELSRLFVPSQLD